MFSGDLDRQITIERKQTPVVADSDFGTQVPVWIPLSTVNGQPEKFWAQVTDVLPSRSEAVSLGLQVARNQTRFRMRYRTDIDSSMRVRLHGDGDDTIYQIIAGPAVVAKEGRKTMIEFVCEKYSS